jgi:hypothetical protein
MTGHIRQRSENTWELKFDIGRDETTGKRIAQFHSFKGTRKEAKLKLAELITSVAKGSYVTRTHLTVGEHVARSTKSQQRPPSDTKSFSQIR